MGAHLKAPNFLHARQLNVVQNWIKKAPLNTPVLVSLNVLVALDITNSVHKGRLNFDINVYLCLLLNKYTVTFGDINQEVLKWER